MPQLISFSNSQMANEASTSTHQAAIVISHPPNFSVFSHYSELIHNSKHTIFFVKTVDKNAFSNGTWVIDIGATDHMVHSINMFSEITSTLHTSVELPNGESILVTRIGTVKLSDSLILIDVLYVPTFSFNLISISKLTASLICCIFFSL